MRTSKFTVEQITHALRRVEGAVAELCRELGSRRRPSAAGSGSTTGWARRNCENSPRDENQKLKQVAARTSPTPSAGTAPAGDHLGVGAPRSRAWQRTRHHALGRGAKLELAASVWTPRIRRERRADIHQVFHSLTCILICCDFAARLL